MQSHLLNLSCTAHIQTNGDAHAPFRPLLRFWPSLLIHHLLHPLLSRTILTLLVVPIISDMIAFLFSIIYEGGLKRTFLSRGFSYFFVGSVGKWVKRLFQFHSYYLQNLNVFHFITNFFLWASRMMLLSIRKLVLCGGKLDNCYLYRISIENFYISIYMSSIPQYKHAYYIYPPL